VSEQPPSQPQETTPPTNPPSPPANEPVAETPSGSPDWVAPDLGTSAMFKSLLPSSGDLGREKKG
jgi:hypothetical protein